MGKIKDLVLSGSLDCKYDGSLGDSGFEFVSASLFSLYDNKSVAQFVSQVVNNLETAGFSADSDCGCHLHIDRGGRFGASVFLGVVALVNSMPESFVSAMFGRSFGTYCGKYSQPLVTDLVSQVRAGVLSPEDALCQLDKTRAGHRGFFTFGSSTFEMRLFAGTVSVPTFVCYLGLLRTLLWYSQSCVSVGAWDSLLSGVLPASFLDKYKKESRRLAAACGAAMGKEIEGGVAFD